jgi:hypothetical protein
MLVILLIPEKKSSDVTKKSEDVKGARINSKIIEKSEREMKRQIVTAIRLEISPEPNEVRTKANDPIKINMDETILADLSSGPYFLIIFNPKISMKIREKGRKVLWVACNKLCKIFEAKKQNVAKMKYKLIA